VAGECVNTFGSFFCSACPAGFKGPDLDHCTDINECDQAESGLVNGGCDKETQCTNTIGSRTCGACENGGDGADGCSANARRDVRVRVVNAIDNSPLSGAEVSMAYGTGNAYQDDPDATALVADDGFGTFTQLGLGCYSFWVTGYVQGVAPDQVQFSSASHSFCLTADMAKDTSKDLYTIIALPPLLKEREAVAGGPTPGAQVRVVLTWGPEDPSVIQRRDLDLELSYPTPDKDCFTTYYQQQCPVGNNPTSQLDNDANDWTAGAETIIITDLKTAPYHFSVGQYGVFKNPGASDQVFEAFHALHQTHAHVSVYVTGLLDPVYQVQIPAVDSLGHTATDATNYWSVFCIDGTKTADVSDTASWFYPTNRFNNNRRQVMPECPPQDETYWTKDEQPIEQ